jgi:aspartokinase/homoserine dehydrogenase 1
MALVNLEGAGMIGVPGTADRLFAALKNAGVSVSLISQASSEHSICIAVPDGLAERARNVIAETFAEELAGGQIQSVDVSPDQSIIAVVGDGMAGTPGIAAKFLAHWGVPINFAPSPRVLPSAIFPRLSTAVMSPVLCALFIPVSTSL